MKMCLKIYADVKYLENIVWRRKWEVRNYNFVDVHLLSSVLCILSRSRGDHAVVGLPPVAVLTDIQENIWSRAVCCHCVWQRHASLGAVVDTNSCHGSISLYQLLGRSCPKSTKTSDPSCSPASWRNSPDHSSISGEEIAADSGCESLCKSFPSVVSLFVNWLTPNNFNLSIIY